MDNRKRINTDSASQRELHKSARCRQDQPWVRNLSPLVRGQHMKVGDKVKLLTLYGHPCTLFYATVKRVVLYAGRELLILTSIRAVKRVAS